RSQHRPRTQNRRRPLPLENHRPLPLFWPPLFLTTTCHPPFAPRSAATQLFLRAAGGASGPSSASPNSPLSPRLLCSLCGMPFSSFLFLPSFFLSLFSPCPSCPLW